MSQQSQRADIEPVFGYSRLLGQTLRWAVKGSNSSRSKDFSVLQNNLRTRRRYVVKHNLITEV